MKVSKVSELKDMLEKFIERYGDLPLAQFDVMEKIMTPVKSATIEPVELERKGLHADLQIYTFDDYNKFIH